jgi:SPP1 family predicted phage head-tail adaptor
MPWPKIEPGDLRHQITFLAQVIGADASGANISWAAAVPPVTTRAAIREMSAEELIRGGQDVSQVLLEVTIRYQDGILANSRFTTEQGDTFIIKAIRNVESRNVLLVMTCIGLGDNS